jgi:hypothetical protein
MVNDPPAADKRAADKKKRLREISKKYGPKLKAIQEQLNAKGAKATGQKAPVAKRKAPVAKGKGKGPRAKL